ESAALPLSYLGVAESIITFGEKICRADAGLACGIRTKMRPYGQKVNPNQIAKRERCNPGLLRRRLRFRRGGGSWSWSRSLWSGSRGLVWVLKCLFLFYEPLHFSLCIHNNLLVLRD